MFAFLDDNTIKYKITSLSYLSALFFELVLDLELAEAYRHYPDEPDHGKLLKSS